MPEHPHDPPSYTPESANEVLEEVKQRLARLRHASAQIAGHQITKVAKSGSNGGGSGAQDWLDASKVAAAELSWFAEAGIVLRDIDQGLLDFPAEREGRPVFLCWRRGEDTVAYWHGPDTGFAGRQPL